MCVYTPACAFPPGRLLAAAGSSGCLLVCPSVLAVLPAPPHCDPLPSQVAALHDSEPPSQMDLGMTEEQEWLALAERDGE